MKYIYGTPVEPLKYNIILTKDGVRIDFDFPPAPLEQIVRYGYLMAQDPRVMPVLITDDAGLYAALAPIIGKTYRGELQYHTRKQSIISLHDTAILGYQRQVIIDPRLHNEIALFWEIYLDLRVFPAAHDTAWQQAMAEVITSELKDPSADAALAEDLKQRLLEQTSQDNTD